jgi:hypothetical protein
MPIVQSQQQQNHPYDDTYPLRLILMHLRSVQKAEAKLSTSIAKHCQVAHLLVLDRVPPTWPFEARTRQKANRTLIGAACITSQPRYRKASCQAAYLESLSATLSVPNTIRRHPDTSEQPVAASLIFFLICSLLSLSPLPYGMHASHRSRRDAFYPRSRPGCRE